jgi:hypothetical protein
LQDYEQVQAVLEEAFQRKPAVETTKLFNALRSRFSGQGAHLTRQQVIDVIKLQAKEISAEEMAAASGAFVEAEASGGKHSVERLEFRKSFKVNAPSHMLLFPRIYGGNGWLHRGCYA